MSELTINGRPRRSMRTSAKAPSIVSTIQTSARATGKRKAQEAEKDPKEKLDYLLTDTKSKLTKLEISNILSYDNFLDLSTESQNLLVSLLPPTAFVTFRPTMPPTHVDYQASQHASESSKDPNSMQIDISSTPRIPAGAHQDWKDCTLATLDPTIFTSPFFLSAARTFQDHLFSGWLGKRSQDNVTRFEAGIRDGSLHAEWKDEVWERDHYPKEKRTLSSDLTALAMRGLLKEGDVLCYRRKFPHLRLVVEKDVLVDRISPRTHSLTVLIPPYTNRSLNPSLLIADHHDPKEEERIQAMDDITDPDVLEDGILDIDRRVSRPDRYVARGAAGWGSTADDPNALDAKSNSRTAWKSFTVWRWREEMREAVELQLLQDRGGRERLGTLSYLKTYCLDKA